MERFVVSARKYRPVTFDTVVGQPHITETLKNAIRNNHLAQAFLFTGPRGVGKTTTARILAKTINCTSLSKELEACDKCESCTSFNDGHSLNIYELDAASNNSVDDIRALVEQVRYAPQMGRYKVYIIDEVHMLSTNAFNAFLKTLEEPPSYAVFILATTEKHKIIPTILSRCQIFDFSRISVEDIARHLASIAAKENVNAEEDALHVIAQKADGALRDALSMFDQLVSFAGNDLTYKAAISNLNILDYDYYFKVTEHILASDTSQVLLAFNEVLSHGFDSHHFLSGLSSHFRDLLVCKDDVTLPLLEVSTSVRDRFKSQSEKCASSWLLGSLDITQLADLHFKSARNQRLHVEFTLLKLCHRQAIAVATEPLATPQIQQIAPKTTTASAPATTPIAPPVPQSNPKPPVSPAVSNPPPSATSPTKSGPGRVTKISLSQNKEDEKKNDTSVELKQTDLPRTRFSPVQLQQHWGAYAKLLNEQGRYALATAMLKRMPEQINDETYSFTVDSHAMEKDLNEIKSELLGHLRQALLNFQLQLELSVELDTKGTNVPYTPSEKFNRLAEIHPMLNELKKRLGLELEY